MSSIPSAGMVTPNRRSRIRFDVPDQVLIQPAFSLIRMGNEIARGPDAVISDVHYLQNIGWELEPHQVSISAKRERSEAVGGLLLASNGLLSVTASHTEIPLFAKPTDLNGSDPSWYDSNVVEQGDVFIQKRVADGDSFETNLSADQSAFPSSPDPRGDNVEMDRVAVGTENHNGAPLMFSFVAPTNVLTAPHRFKNLLFNGPAGSGNKWKGTGRYQLSFSGGGQCSLDELVRFNGESADEWYRVFDFQYAPAYSVGGQVHRVMIRPIEAGRANYAPYGAIVFTVKVDEKAVYSGGPGLLSVGVTKKPGRTAQSTYILSRTKARTPDSPPAMVSVPVRVDSRRDQRIPYQLTKLVYRTSGYLIDDFFALDFYPSANLTLKVYTLGYVYGSTSLTPRLFRENGVEISAATTDTYLHTFTLPARERYFYVRWDFTGTEDSSPLLEGYQVVMDQYIATVEPGEFEPEAAGLNPGSFTSVSITGAEGDPSHESMRLGIEDLLSNMTRLSVRGEMLAQLDIEDAANDPPEWTCALFRGHQIDAESIVKGHGTEVGGFPDRNWKGYDLTFMGVWKRLMQALSSIRFDWHSPDPNAPVGPDGIRPPYKASEAIDIMLGWAGFPPSMRNIPDSDIRLYPSTTNDLFIEPLANLCDYIVRIAKDYLAMYLAFDPNQGTYGKWTLTGAPPTPYVNVGHFVDEAPEDKLAHCIESYPENTVPFLKGTFSPKTRPLEANRLVVTGTGILAGSPPDMKLLTQVAYNFRSCNFFNLASDHPYFPDPEHPDFIGYDKPLYVVDPTLQTPEAVNLVLRRVFDVACLSVRQITSMAPLLLIDHETEANKKRSLRFFDPVSVTRFGETSQWLVRNCNPAYEHDGVQLATYQLEAPREPFLMP